MKDNEVLNAAAEKYFEDNKITLKGISGSDYIDKEDFLKYIEQFQSESKQVLFTIPDAVKELENNYLDYDWQNLETDYCTNKIMSSGMPMAFINGYYEGRIKSILQYNSVDGFSEDGWIRVEDRLPDYDEPVLWLDEHGTRFIGDIDKDDSWQSFQNENTYIDGNVIKITHWMHLPEYPKDFS